jgi:putative FmdB family regulatory protein
MPTYEYACKNCDEHVEVVQSFKDEPLRTCPKCGGPLRKVFGSIGISFKGSGFYKTDTRKEPKSESSSTSSSPAKDGAAAKSGSSTDKAAPAAKSSSGDSGSSPKAAAS